MTPVYKLSDSRSFAGDVTYYSSMLAGNAAYSPSDEYVLAETTLTSTAPSVTFSSLDTLAAGYKHLQIRFVARTDYNNNNDTFSMQLNGDTAATYAAHRVYGAGTGAVTANGYANQSSMTNLGQLSALTSTANAFAGGVIDILDAFETTKYKTVRALVGMWRVTSGLMGLNSGLWRNTNAITSILIDGTYGNFVAGSSFTLIGIK